MPVQVLGFHHFSMLVSDLDRAAAFYEGCLGFQRIQRPNFKSRGVWYNAAGKEFHLIEDRNVPARNEGHPALEVNDLRAALDGCLVHGGTVQSDIFVREHDGSHSAFIRDPDGNLIELCNHGAAFG